MKRTAILVLCLFVVAMASTVVEAKPKQPYAGLSKCKMCHQGHALWGRWEGTKHAATYKNLVKKYPAEAKNGKCLKCHATGFGKGGFDPAKKESVKEYGAVTCEGCHGPMGGHAGNPMDAGLKKTKMRCHKCHFAPPMKPHKHHVQLHGKK